MNTIHAGSFFLKIQSFQMENPGGQLARQAVVLNETDPSS